MDKDAMMLLLCSDTISLSNICQSQQIQLREREREKSRRALDRPCYNIQSSYTMCNGYYLYGRF